VELDPAPQLEFPRGGRGDPVRLGEQGDQFQIVIALEETVEDVRGQVRGRGLLVVLRVERGRIDALRDHHRARGRGVGEQGQREDERGQDDAEAVWGHGHALQGARSETTRV
jgi:hypothetical protein